MDFCKSKFLTLFLLFSSFHLCLANEEPSVNPLAQSENFGQKPPYEKDGCNYGHTTCCGGGDYSNPPYVQNPNNKCCNGPSFQPNPTCSWQGQAGDYCNSPCVQNPSNKGYSGPSGQPSTTCQWKGPCPSCGCVGSNVKVEGQLESDHSSSEPMPPNN